MPAIDETPRSAIEKTAQSQDAQRQAEAAIRAEAEQRRQTWDVHAAYREHLAQAKAHFVAEPASRSIERGTENTRAEMQAHPIAASERRDPELVASSRYQQHEQARRAAHLEMVTVAYEKHDPGQQLRNQLHEQYRSTENNLAHIKRDYEPVRQAVEKELTDFRAKHPGLDEIALARKSFEQERPNNLQVRASYENRLGEERMQYRDPARTDLREYERTIQAAANEKRQSWDVQAAFRENFVEANRKYSNEPASQSAARALQETRAEIDYAAKKGIDARPEVAEVNAYRFQQLEQNRHVAHRELVERIYEKHDPGGKILREAWESAYKTHGLDRGVTYDSAATREVLATVQKNSAQLSQSVEKELTDFRAKHPGLDEISLKNQYMREHQQQQRIDQGQQSEQKQEKRSVAQGMAIGL